MRLAGMCSDTITVHLNSICWFVSRQYISLYITKRCTLFTGKCRRSKLWSLQTRVLQSSRKKSSGLYWMFLLWSFWCLWKSFVAQQSGMIQPSDWMPHSFSIGRLYVSHALVTWTRPSWTCLVPCMQHLPVKMEHSACFLCYMLCFYIVFEKWQGHKFPLYHH